MDEFRRKLEAQRVRHRQQQAETRQEVFGQDAADLWSPRPSLPDLSQMPVTEALAAYEAWAEQAIVQERQQFIDSRLQTMQADPVMATAIPLAQQSPLVQLTQIDNLVEQLFDLHRVFPHIRPQTDIFVCQSTAEFLRPLTRIGLSTAEQIRLSQQSDAPILKRIAYYLPDEGCYVNGPLLLQQAQTATVAEALAHTDTFYQVVTAVTQQMYGWGFLLDYTLAGQERKRLNLWPDELAHHLGLTQPASPYQAQSQVVHYYGSLASAGWCRWITAAVLQMAQRKQLGGWQQTQFTWQKFGKLLKRLATDVGEQPISEFFVPIFNAVQDTFMTSQTGLTMLHKQLNKSRQWAAENEVRLQQRWGWSAQAWLQQTLLNSVEARVGSFCLPYALTVAGHVTYQIDQVTADKLTHDLAQVPQSSLDTRLWMLSALEKQVKYNVTSMANGAWEKFHFESPPELKRA